MNSLQSTLEEVLRNRVGNSLNVHRLIPLSGGDINEVFRIETSEDNYCLKLNNAVRYPTMFEKEAHGLNILSNSSFRIPEVIDVGAFEKHSFLILEFIENGTPKPDFWKSFAEDLCDLHSIHRESFGLQEDNFIGTLHQRNNSHANWSDFLYSERLLPMVELAVDKQLLNNRDISNLEKLKTTINGLYGDRQPALLHGDLWSGNYMVDKSGDPVLIDPAVYYGHPDMDLAMTQLFGGFDSNLYMYYNEINPLGDNWDSRIKLSKLYPILVHVNLFGGHYVRQYRELVNRLI